MFGFHFVLSIVEPLSYEEANKLTVFVNQPGLSTLTRAGTKQRVSVQLNEMRFYFLAHLYFEVRVDDKLKSQLLSL